MDISKIKTYHSFDIDTRAEHITLAYENDGIERKKIIVVGLDELKNKIQKSGLTLFDLIQQEKEKFASEILGNELASVFGEKIDISDYISRKALIEEIKKCQVPINAPELESFIALVLSQPSISSLFKQGE